MTRCNYDDSSSGTQKLPACSANAFLSLLNVLNTLCCSHNTYVFNQTAPDKYTAFVKNSLATRVSSQVKRVRDSLARLQTSGKTRVVLGK